MDCPECGEKVDEAAKFCLRCGRALAPPATERHVRVWQRLWWLIPVSIGMLLAAAAVLAWLLWLKPPVSDENGIGGVLPDSSPVAEGNVGDSALVTAGQLPSDTLYADQPAIEPTVRSTVTSSSTESGLPTATSPFTATPPPTAAVPERSGLVIYLPLVVRHWAPSGR